MARHISCNLVLSSDMKQTDFERYLVLFGPSQEQGEARAHTIALVELDPGANSDRHYHQSREESYFILEGEGQAIIGEKTFIIKAGDLLQAKSGEAHEFINQSNNKMRYLVITAPCWQLRDSYK